MVELEAKIARKDPRLPRFVVIPGRAVAQWNLTATTTVDVVLNGEDIGRRSLTRWDDQKWFITITDAVCKSAGVDVGDSVRLRIELADAALPSELQELIDSSAAARARWERLTPPQQRMLREHVASAKKPETRRMRARRGLVV